MVSDVIVTYFRVDIDPYIYIFHPEHPHVVWPLDVSILVANSLERQDMPFFQREVLSRTLQQRRIELLTITAPEGEPGARPFRDRKWVFMSARFV